VGKLNLRVSVAALARVLLDDFESGRTLLALERTATLIEGVGGPRASVRAKPFGGGVRLRDLDTLRAAIGDFRFDSARSQEEADFRVLIREADWPQVQAFCLRHLQQDEDQRQQDDGVEQPPCTSSSSSVHDDPPLCGSVVG